jgi:hypothetical protein
MSFSVPIHGSTISQPEGYHCPNYSCAALGITVLNNTGNPISPVLPTHMTWEDIINIYHRNITQININNMEATETNGNG